MQLKQTVPDDQVESYRVIWEGVALPSILYGVEALLVSQGVIEALDKVQAQVAKALIGVSVSSANVVAEVELGFRPFHLRVAAATVKFVLKHTKSSKGCKLTKELMRECLADPNNSYRKHLDRLLQPIGENGGETGGTPSEESDRVGRINVDNDTLAPASDLVEEAEACQGGIMVKNTMQVQDHECGSREQGQLLQESCGVCRSGPCSSVSTVLQRAQQQDTPSHGVQSDQASSFQDQG